jgi:anti-anti-sigma factor
VLLLYASEAERRAGLTAWVHRGLEQGEKVIYAEGPVAARESLFAVLEASGLDTRVARREGRLVALPSEEFYPPARQDQVVDQGLADGFTRVRMAADAKAALSLLTPDTHLRFEHNMDRLCRTRPVSAMCQYARAATTGTVLRNTVDVHVVGVRQTGFATGADGHRLVLRGEIDLVNADVFAAVVATATSRDSRPVWLDLAAVDYLDVAACRSLLAASRGFRTNGGQLLLVAPQPQVERTMRLLGVATEAGVRLLGGDP